MSAQPPGFNVSLSTETDRHACPPPQHRRHTLGPAMQSSQMQRGAARVRGGGSHQRACGCEVRKIEHALTCNWVQVFLSAHIPAGRGSSLMALK